QTGAKILAVLAIVGSILAIFSAIFPGPGDFKQAELRVASAVWAVINIVAALLVFLAISKRKSNLMIPMVAISLVNVLIYIVWVALAVYTIFADRRTAMYRNIMYALVAQARLIHGPGIETYLGENSPYLLSAFNTFGLLISFWVYSVFYDCYKCI
ncbi:hypothetical protein PFISCL1PPCAC_17113, partial [Pristionchus fissidentatus]